MQPFSRNTGDRIASWLKSHTAAERSFGRALQGYFSEQADRIANAIGENFPGGLPSPEQVPLIFNAAEESERLQSIVRRNLSGLMVIGAKAEQRAYRRRSDAKAADDEFEGIEIVDLPPETLQAIKRSLRELELQDYWQKIQDETATNLRSIIEQAIEGKLSNYSLGMLIREELGGMPANKRAQKIARTETTGAMNAGHLAFAEELIEDGIVTGKQWLSIGDSDCRESHAALNNVIVRARENFSVGGFGAPYPGYALLPGRERINCRCTWVSVLADGLLD